MRNLKRAVSLALASIMLLGTMVIGSAATSFTDADDITNVDAVTVLSALDVMRGRDTGDFDPTAVVTRGEMAAILCRVMYGADVKAGNFTGLSSFTDTQKHWAEDYINMAASEGWILGNGDGTFSPDETVTTAQAAVMMQRALGYYDSKDENVDPAAYVLDAIRLGNRLEMFEGLSVAATQGLSRDDVAGMTYNLMFNTMRVAYSTFTGIYYAVDATNPSVTNSNVSVEDDKTIAALVFDVTLEEDIDDMGRPVKNVVVDNETLAVTNVAHTALFVDISELDDVNKKMAQDAKDNTNLRLNGVLTTLDKVFDGNDESHAGTVIQVYDKYNTKGEKDKDSTLYIAYTYNYGEVSKVEYDKSDDETTIRIDSKNYTLDGKTSFKKGDMVMFTAAGTQIQTLADTIVVKGEVTGVSNKFVKLDGVTYTYTTSGMLTSSQLGDTYALYVTPHGYVIGVEEIEDNGGVNSNFLYITYAQISMGDVKAKAVLADGTEQVIEVSKIYSETAGDYVDCVAVNTGDENSLTYSSDASASAYSYELSGGKYKLTAEAGVKAQSGAHIKNSYNTTVDADGKNMTGFLAFNDDTVFVDVENGTAYIGFETVPSYGAFSSGNLFYVDNVVFMIDGDLDDAEAGTFVYIEGDDMYVTKVNGKNYYVYTEAYINGELVKDGLYSEVKTMDVNNLYEVELDSNGYVTSVVETLALPTLSDTDSEVRTVGKSTIYTVGGNRYTYDKNSIFVLVDHIDGEIGQGSTSDLMEQGESDDEMTQLLVVADDKGYIEVAYIVLSEKMP